MARDLNPNTDTTQRLTVRRPEAQIRLLFEKFPDFVEEYRPKISLGGVFIATSQPKPVGTTVSCEFRLADGFRLCQALGEVLWVRLQATEQDRPAGMGIRFQAIDDEGRKLLLKILEEQLKNGGEPFEVERIPADAALSGPEPGEIPEPKEDPASTHSRRLEPSSISASASTHARPVVTPPTVQPVPGVETPGSLPHVELPEPVPGLDALTVPAGSAEAMGASSTDPTDTNFNAPWGEHLPEIPAEVMDPLDDKKVLASAVEDFGSDGQEAAFSQKAGDDVFDFGTSTVSEGGPGSSSKEENSPDIPVFDAESLDQDAAEFLELELPSGADLEFTAEAPDVPDFSGLDVLEPDLGSSSEPDFGSLLGEGTPEPETSAPTGPFAESPQADSLEPSLDDTLSRIDPGPEQDSSPTSQGVLDPDFASGGIDSPLISEPVDLDLSGSAVSDSPPPEMSPPFDSSLSLPDEADVGMPMSMAPPEERTDGMSPPIAPSEPAPFEPAPFEPAPSEPAPSAYDEPLGEEDSSPSSMGAGWASFQSADSSGASSFAPSTEASDTEFPKPPTSALTSSESASESEAAWAQSEEDDQWEVEESRFRGFLSDIRLTLAESKGRLVGIILLLGLVGSGFVFKENLLRAMGLGSSPPPHSPGVKENSFAAGGTSPAGETDAEDVTPAPLDADENDLGKNVSESLAEAPQGGGETSELAQTQPASRPNSVPTAIPEPASPPARSSEPRPSGPANSREATRIQAIDYEQASNGTRVVVKLDGEFGIDRLEHNPLSYTLLKEQISLKGIDVPFNSTIDVGTLELDRIRTGLNAGRLNLVFDLSSEHMTLSGFQASGARLEILVHRR